MIIIIAVAFFAVAFLRRGSKLLLANSSWSSASSAWYSFPLVMLTRSLASKKNLFLELRGPATFLSGPPFEFRMEKTFVHLLEERLGPTINLKLCGLRPTRDSVIY